MFRQSESITEFAAAMVEAQKEIGTVTIPKSAVNPHFKSSYAKIDSYLPVLLPILTRNGIAIIQSPGRNEKGEPVLTTRLLHKSGQWMEGDVDLILDKNNMQGEGSAITYAKRYGLGAMTGAALDEDDDGNAASNVKESNTGASSSQKTGSGEGVRTPDGDTFVPTTLETYVVRCGLPSVKGKRLKDLKHDQIENLMTWIDANVAVPKRTQDQKDFVFWYGEYKAKQI